MRQQELEKAAAYWEDRIDATKAMEPETLLSEMEQFIRSHNTCALATAADDFVRCTPIEYRYEEKCFWMLSEGGLKFRALAGNNNVCIAIYDPYKGFGSVAGMQITGRAELVDADTDTFCRALGYWKISTQALAKQKLSLHLIRIVPRRIDFLNAAFSKRGLDARQYLEFTDDK